MVTGISHSGGASLGKAFCEEIGFTAHRLPDLLTQTANGEQYQPTQIRLGLNGNKLDLPLAQLTLPEPARGWESGLAHNAAHQRTVFTTRVGSFLMMADTDTPVGPRLTSLQATLQDEADRLRERQKKLRADYDRVSAALRQQQEALATQRRGLINIIFGVAFDAAKAVGLWNTRESLALRLDGGEVALQLIVSCAGRLGEAGINLQQWRELAVAAAQTLSTERVAQRQRLGDLSCWAPDLALDHGQIAVLIARQDVTHDLVADRIFDPPSDQAAWLGELRATAAQDAARWIAGLNLSTALEFQREAEGLREGLNSLLLFGQAVLEEGCLRRGPAWATRRPGRRTLLQVTADARPLFQAQMERGTLRSPAGGLPGQVAFLELVDQIEPDDLTVVRQALAALDEAQPRSNNALLEELLAPEEIAPLPVPPLPKEAENGHGPLPTEELSPLVV